MNLVKIYIDILNKNEEKQKKNEEKQKKTEEEQKKPVEKEKTNNKYGCHIF